MRSKVVRLGFVLGLSTLAITAAGACAGHVGGQDSSDGDTATAPSSAAGRGGLGSMGIAGQGTSAATGDTAIGPRHHVRRLTRTEYNFTVADLLGDTTAPADAWPSEEKVGGFNNNAAALTFPPTLTDSALEAATRMAKLAVAKANQWQPCAGQATADRTCARSFLQTLALQAWRRPASDEDLTRLLVVFDLGMSHAGFTHGLGLATEALLASPAFLFRIEAVDDAAIAGKSEPVRPTSYDMASRLSYTLWRSLPDKELLDEAGRDALRSDTTLATQVQRMLADPRAGRSARDFFGQWQELDRVDRINKDPAAFPRWRDTLGPLFRKETEAFVSHVMLDGDSRFGDLFAADFTFANNALAAYYELPGPSGETFVRTALPASSGRAGLLTQGSFLATRASFLQSSPTLRGAFVRTHVLCDTLPPPPPDVANTPKPPSPTTTTRQRYQQHQSDPNCSGCHALTDSIGFGFENFDGAGAFRRQDNGLPIDASGEVTDNAIGKFQGAVDLAKALADSPSAKQCLIKHWFSFVTGRVPDAADAAELADLTTIMDKQGMRALLVATTQSPSFKFLRTTQPARR